MFYEYLDPLDFKDFKIAMTASKESNLIKSTVAV